MKYDLTKPKTGEKLGSFTSLDAATKAAIYGLRSGGVTECQLILGPDSAVFSAGDLELRAAREVVVRSVRGLREVAPAGSKPFRFPGRPTYSGWSKTREVDPLPKATIAELLRAERIICGSGSYLAVYVALSPDEADGSLTPVAAYKLDDPMAAAAKTCENLINVVMGSAGIGCLPDPPPGTVALYVLRRLSNSWEAIAKRLAKHGEGASYSKETAPQQGALTAWEQEEPMPPKEPGTKPAPSKVKKAPATKQPKPPTLKQMKTEKDPRQKELPLQPSKGSANGGEQFQLPANFKTGYTKAEKEAMERKAREEGL